jgi:enamine deaminase RidA (YjgF/YER057c/UK114 family)
MNLLRLLLPLLCLAPALLHAQSGLRYVAPDAATGSSKAVVFSDRALLHTEQLLPAANVPAAEQPAALLRQLQTLLKAGGHGEALAVRLEWCAQDNATVAAIRQAMAREFAGAHKPAATFVVGKMRAPHVAVALNAIAVAAPGARVAKPTVVATPSGKLSVLPAGGVTQVSGEAIKGANTRESARLTLASLLKILQFLRLTPADAVQFKVFLQPVADADQVVAAFRETYGADAAIPPLVFVEWQAQPSLEIEMVTAATSPAAGAPARGVGYLTPPHMTQPTVYSRIAPANSPAHIYVSTLTSAKSGDGAAQARDIYAQLQVILAECDSSFDQLVKATYYTSDTDGSNGLVGLRPSLYNPKRPPAASKAGVASTGFDARTLSLDMIAVPR